MPTSNRHPFVKATLRRAVRATLTDKHDHEGPRDFIACPVCAGRLWEMLDRHAPKPWIGSV